MNRNSGQLLLAFAVIALLGGLGFAFTKKDISLKSGAPTVAAGEAFASAAPAALPEPSLGWIRQNTAEPNPWAHDLFTPVEVTWSPKTSEYVAKSDTVITPVAAAPTLGLRLLGIKHPKYRLRISTIAEAPSKQVADATIFFLDDETRTTIRGKVGETVGQKGAQVKILKYEPKQVDPKTGATLKPASVVLKDLVLRRDVTVGQTPVEFSDRYVITFAGEASDTPVWTASAVGEKFENEGGSYAIKGVDFEGQSVTVEKSYVADAVKNTRKVMTETLTPVAPVSASQK